MELYAVAWQPSQMKSETERALLGKDVNLASQEKRAEAPPPVCAEQKPGSALWRSIWREDSGDVPHRPVRESRGQGRGQLVNYRATRHLSHGPPPAGADRALE